MATAVATLSANFFLLCVVGFLVWYVVKGKRGSWPRGGFKLAQVAEQLRVVERCTYYRKPALGKGEYRVFMAASKYFTRWEGFRVVPQLSMGEVIKCNDNAGHSCVNSKRIDVAVIDRHGYLVAAIEFNGSGHFMSADAVGRDAVKAAALRSAGVPLVVINQHDKPDLWVQKFDSAMQQWGVITA